jgi:hypothetical protein
MATYEVFNSNSIKYLLVSVLANCQPFTEQCANMGFEPGTEAYLECINMKQQATQQLLESSALFLQMGQPHVISPPPSTVVCNPSGWNNGSYICR